MSEDTDTEAALMGALLAEPSMWLGVAVARGVRAAWFIDDVWRVTWRAFVAAWKRGEAESCDSSTVLDEARRLAAGGNDPSLKDRVTVARYAQAIEGAGIAVPEYCAILKDRFLKKNLRACVAKVLQGAESSSAELMAVDMRTGIDKVLDEATAGKEVPAAEVFEGVMAEYREAYQRRIVEKRLDWTPGLRMPWVELTRIMNGVRPGLHVVAARPSVGKTSFAVNLMRFWCDQGVRVVFCSLDMPRREVLRRFLSERARVSIGKAVYSPTHADLEALDAAKAEQVALPLTVVEIRDVDEFATFCQVRKATGKIDVAVIDYLQLMHARALGKEDAVEYARISYVSNAIKDLANRLELPVVALSQLNRESVKGDRAGQMPTLADLRGSGTIEQDAFTVSLLHRDAQVVTKWGTPDNAPLALLPGGKGSVGILDAVWWCLVKSQNGGLGQYPFVVWKPYFAWMLGDGEAKALEYTEGAGATKKVYTDNAPKFARVHGDWRQDPMEKWLASGNALIGATPIRDEVVNTYQPPDVDNADPEDYADEDDE